IRSELYVKGRDADLSVLSLVRLCRAMATVVFSAACGSVAAAQIDSDTQAKIRWDNTIKYSAAWRVQERSATLSAGSNSDDGNRNFDRGLISNRLDLLSEFDLAYKDVGTRISGAAW